MKDQDLKVPDVASALPKVMTVLELAEYLRVHPTTVYRLLRAKQLPGFRVGYEWRFSVDVIDRWRSGEEQASIGTTRSATPERPIRGRKPGGGRAPQ
jgi:excisionase family DNA binding protein